tara:strand:+ start:6672 stop:7205 length:534 start_codon:yes stop_codon:yes gene_type:complete
MENTINGLMNSLELVENRKFKYWEFDIRESLDGIIFVFHDDQILVDGELIETAKLNFSEIIKAGEDLGVKIPTFSDVVAILSDRKEDVMVEVKELRTDDARRTVITAISSKPNWKLMATPTRFLECFPSESRDYWEGYTRDLDVEFVRVGRHKLDLFSASKSYFRWKFAQFKWFFGI